MADDTPSRDAQPFCQSDRKALTDELDRLEAMLAARHHACGDPLESQPGANLFFDEGYAYFNKQSSKVNSGLDFGGVDVDGGEGTGPLETNKPPLNISFRVFTVPSAARNVGIGGHRLAQRLLHPPENAFVYGLLSINWVVSVLGEKHFVRRQADRRHVLAPQSELRMHGRRWGLPAVFHEWLCGDDDCIGAAEQGLWLTPKFFQCEVEEWECGIAYGD